MKIMKIINGYFNNNLTKGTDLDDYSDFSDFVENITPDENEYKNPLCYDFWEYQITKNRIFGDFVVDFQSVINNYTKNI